MIYETINWDAEAKRIARAFGLEEKAEFRRRTRRGGEQHVLFKGRDYLIVHSSLHLSAIYKPDTLWFQLHFEGASTWMTLDRDGKPLQVGEDFTYAEPLAKGLFHLGLLTWEIEVALLMTVSEEQKAEWTRHYESFTYRTMDWDAEAIRVARAFGLSESCTFEETKRQRRRELRSVNGSDECALTEREALFLRCNYTLAFGLTFSISRRDSFDSTDIGMDWDGEFWNEVYDEDQFLEPLAKGLFHLGMLNPEAETVLRVSITAHQKLEWALDYEERYGL